MAAAMASMVQHISEGLNSRNKHQSTLMNYMSKIKRLQEFITVHLDLFPTDPFERAADGNPKILFEKIYQWNLPLCKENGEVLFALLISVNKDLPKRGQAISRIELDPNNSSSNPAANVVTVTSGTMVGYKSAIVWLHKWVDSSKCLLRKTHSSWCQ